MCRSNDATFYLLNVELLCTITFVMAGRFKDVVSGFARQAASETEALHIMQDELSQLHPQYQRYVKLVQELKVSEERAQIAIGMLMARGNGPEFDEVYDSAERLDSAGGLASVDVSELPLWKVLREMLRQVPEMQVIDIERALKEFGIEAKRQAIDSSIKTHKDIFAIRKRGAEKFISLKGV